MIYPRPTACKIWASLFLIYFFFLDLGFTQSQKVLTVYTHTAFQRYGIGPFLKQEFEKRHPVKIVYVDCGTGVGLLNRLSLEGDRTRADLVIGIDPYIATQSAALGIFQQHNLQKRSVLSTEPEIPAVFVPYCYNYIAFIYDKRHTLQQPQTAREFFKNPPGSFIVQDPRFSSIGRTFLLWVAHLFPQDHGGVWRTIKAKGVKLAPGWAASYVFFKAGEAPFMLSYLTTPLYEQYVHNNPHIRSLVFPEGNPLVMELAGQLRCTKNPMLAEAFLQFLLHPIVQEKMLEKNWMFPVVGPTFPSTLPQPSSFCWPNKKLIFLSPALQEQKQHLKKWLQIWHN